MMDSTPGFCGLGRELVDDERPRRASRCARPGYAYAPPRGHLEAAGAATPPRGDSLLPLGSISRKSFGN